MGNLKDGGNFMIKFISNTLCLALFIVNISFGGSLWAEDTQRQTEPDGDPAIGVPLIRTLTNYRLSEAPDLIEIDRTTGERLGNFSIPTNEALTPVQLMEIRKAKEEKGKSVDPAELRFRSGHLIRPDRGVEPEVSQAMNLDEGYRFLLVQFGDVVKPEIIEALKEEGFIFYDYVHFHAFYVKIPSGSMGRLEGLLTEGEVRYIGTIPPEAKIQEVLWQKALDNTEEAFEVAVLFFKNETSDQEGIAADFLEIYSRTDQRIVGKVSGDKILEIYLSNTVRWVEEWITPELDNLEGRMIHGADIIAQIGDYTGSGVNVATMDTGIAQSGSTYHPDLPGTRITDQWDYQNNDAIANDDYGNGHGTHVAGSLGGEGNNDPDWVGMAPESNLHIYKLCCGTNQFSWFEDALQRASDHTVRVINNSWSGGVSGGYNSNAELADRAVRGGFGHYMNLVVSSGNHNNLVKSPGSAKNVITVGAVHDGNWPNEEILVAGSCLDYVWPPGDRACFSGYGPIDVDGNGYYRIKPDVMSTGPRTMSTVPWYLPEGNYYDILDGTSMSAPKITGLIALFLDAYPSWNTWPEIVKARLIATAINIGSSDYYGHGLVDSYHFIYDEPGIMENVLNITSSVANNDDSKTYNFTVPSGFHEVRVVLTWADPPGSEEAINDLDLKVYDGAGVLKGSSTWNDHVVEKVITSSGTAGTWQAVVDPFDLGDPSQAFAITAYVVMDPPSLSLNATSSQRWLKPGEYFYFYTDLNNSGGPAAGSYVFLNAPNGSIFQVQGGRLYPAEGYSRSEYYNEDEIHAHTNPDYNEYSMATGIVTGMNNPLVRWYIRIDPATTFNGDGNFYVRGYALNGLTTSQETVYVGVDDTPPYGSIQINSGATETMSLIVTLNLSAGDATSGVEEMRFSNDNSTWSSWESYSATKSNWDLSAYGGSAGTGTKTVYAQYKDEAENTSSTYSDTIIYAPDTTPPSPNPMTWLTEPYDTSTSSITMVATTATDPHGPVEYYFYYSDLTGGGGGTHSSWQTGTSYTDSGLGTNHQYRYWVRARDNALTPNYTSWSSYSDEYTAIEIPSGINFGTITNSAISVKSTNTPSNLTSGGSGLWLECWNNDDSDWKQDNNFWTQTGLSVNNIYYFRARARNGDGDETAYCSWYNRYTLANIPAAPSVNNPTPTTLDVAINPNGNPNYTECCIWNGGGGGYYLNGSGGNNGLTPFWQTISSWSTVTVTGLAPGSYHCFYVSARNENGIITSWSPPSCAYTLEPCLGDFDIDHDVDGSDLATFAAGGVGVSLGDFADEFGKNDCP